MTGIALIAGADTAVAAGLGVSMVALQASIGTLNDIVDAPRDREAKPRKPIPARLVSPGAAMAVAVGSGGLGLVLGGLFGPLVLLALGVVVLAVGYAYDWIFKGTAFSWLPFAIGIPLLPVYGWVGATGGWPRAFAILIPVAVVAGAALAVANARADEVRDRAADTVSVATSLGGRRSWLVEVGLLAVVVGAAVVTLLVGGAGIVALGAAALATGVIVVGLAVGRSDDPAHRERSWEIEAIGVALLAAAWLAGMPARRLGSGDRSDAASTQRRRCGRGRSRSRDGAWRWSGTSRGWHDRSHRSIRGPRHCRGPRQAHPPHRPGSALR